MPNAPDGIDILEGQECPFCHEKTMTMTESEKDIPYFGLTYIFSMDCSSCKYHKADVESAQEREPTRYTIELSSEEDMKIRIVKSSEATVKLPHITTITPGTASNGYVTNVEGILNRIKREIENVRDGSDDDEDKKKAKNLLKKLTRIMWGQEKIKLILEDPTGNSAIISEKATKERLKK